MTEVQKVLIRAWVQREILGLARGKCKDAARRASEVFPFLEVRKGLYYAPWGRDQHWWCRCSTTNQIVDPTAGQFPCGSMFPESDNSYQDLTDLPDEYLQGFVPTGVCANCGRPAYRGEIFCCDACTAECIEDLNRGIRYALVEDE
jgi:hypothetical protein